MSLVRLFEDSDVEIIPVAEYELMDDMQADCEGKESGRSSCLDIGGSLTRPNAEMESGAWNQGCHYKFRGPLDVEEDIGPE